MVSKPTYEELEQRISELESEVDECKQTEESITASLNEKEVMLRKIHHRIKNSMQIIVSLLRMYLRRTKDKQVGQILNNCRDRVNALSLIHEVLYQSENLSRINYEVYLKLLCRNLSQVYSLSRKGITISIEECNISLNIDQGIAIGMVISELVSNAIKHGFKTGEGGNISISLSCLNGKDVELIIQDNGKGLPPEIDILNSSSLGLQLTAAAVTRELNGSIEVERNGGTCYFIRFKCKNS